MSISALAALVASLGFVAAIIWAGLMDLVTMKIRNELILFLLATYAALAPLAGFGVADIAWGSAVAAGVLAASFICFAMGWIGGGDAKFAAVVALWLGADLVLPYLLYTTVFGGLLTLAILQFRSIVLPPQCISVGWINRLHAPKSGVPYGVAIASAALVVFLQTPWIEAFT
jgi:prepilin peptidase CpaA